ncbi:MAG TPA: ABC transporter ATP-binding protein [Thermoplasmata archaeon]|nr:ABC transporter ATP-binding protein [Thermoplasmata archaeon]
MGPESGPSNAGEPLIEVTDLKKLFPVKKGVFGRVVGHVHAVDGVSLSVMRGETLGLVGESGCGKTTVGRAILRLVEPTDGKVVFNGQDVLGLHPGQLRAIRKRMQIVFQDPYSSLDPRMTIERIVGEGFAVHGSPKGSKDPNVAKRERIHELIEQVGLSHDHLSRLPHEFSGGQRQRIALARALALDPDFIVLDEPTSALDVSVQAQALNLLKRLQSKLGLSYLFISHDLSVVGHMSDRIAVMYLGKIVELAPADVFLRHALHPYTQALIASIPMPDPKMRKDRKGIEGEVPSPTNPPKGCRFHPRCPKAFADCGWNAGDLADWLKANGQTDQDGVVAKDAAKVREDGFVLGFWLRAGSEPLALLKFLREVTTRSKAEVPMFQAVQAIDTLIGNRVIELRCMPLRADRHGGKSKSGGKKLPSKLVADKVYHAIVDSYTSDSSHNLGRLLLPPEVKGSRVYVRVIGPEANWDTLRTSLRAFFEKRKAAGERFAGSVKGFSIRKAKGPKLSVVVKFKPVEEPPTYDLGGGHMVSCLLCKHGEPPAP